MYPRISSIDQPVASYTVKINSAVIGATPARTFEIDGALTFKNLDKYASDGKSNSLLIASNKGCGAVFALFPILLLLKVVY